MTKNFINLSKHGGCSRKTSGTRLKKVLDALQLPNDSDSPIAIWEDSGVYPHPDGSASVINIDIVLPVTNDPEAFGEIVVAHVLSDIYATGAKPQYAVNYLSLPDFTEEHDEAIVSMLNASIRRLSTIGVQLVGGHTMEKEELEYGLVAVGTTEFKRLISIDGAQLDDVLILTKPLGTNVASRVIRHSPDSADDFEDIVSGMRELNNIVAELMFDHGVNACTDISGYGFLGHLHNMLRASQVAAEIHMSSLPIYESAKRFGSDEHFTKMLRKNEAYVRSFVERQVTPTWVEFGALFDAQVSGGLLISVPSNKLNSFLEAIQHEGANAHIVGQVIEGRSGYMKII